MKLSFVPRTPMASIMYQGVGLVFWIVVLAVVIHWMGDVSESNERAGRAPNVWSKPAANR